jgi:hypothetical protein
MVTAVGASNTSGHGLWRGGIDAVLERDGHASRSVLGVGGPVNQLRLRDPAIARTSLDETLRIDLEADERRMVADEVGHITDCSRASDASLPA